MSRSGSTSWYFTERGCKSPVTTVWAARVCVCVCVGLLTGGTLADAVVLAVPVPQQQGGVPGARQDVAVAADVGLGASQTRDHVAVAEHDLGQLACRSEQTDYVHILVSNRIFFFFKKAAICFAGRLIPTEKESEFKGSKDVFFCLLIICLLGC